MPDERRALAELLERESDSDLLREMISYAIRRLMQLDVKDWSAPPMASVARAARTATCPKSLCSHGVPARVVAPHVKK